VLILGGLPEPSVQFVVREGATVVARLDLAYEPLRIGIEYDGDLRFTADDVLRNPARVVAQVRAAISQAIN
jgi:hypothetical protein